MLIRSNAQTTRLPGERSDPPVARPSPSSRANKRTRLDFAPGDHSHEFVAAKMSKVNTQTVPQLTETLVQFGQVDFDSSNVADLSTESLICRRSGIYTVKYQIRWANGTAATFRKSFLYMHNTIVHTDLNTEPNNNFQGASVCSGSVDLDLNAGQELTLKVYHNNGSNLDITNLNGNTWLSMTLGAFRAAS